jgi:hypothetical protein
MVGHIIIPERLLLQRINKKRSRPIESIEGLGLNKLSLKDYEHIFKESGLSIEYWKTNCGKHLGYRVASFLAKVPLLREHFTFNLYCILKKRGPSSAD